MKKHGKFLHWLRCWNPPSWFPNPFYSPSYAYFWYITAAAEAFYEGFDLAISVIGKLPSVPLSEEFAKLLDFDDLRVRMEPFKED